MVRKGQGKRADEGKENKGKGYVWRLSPSTKNSGYQVHPCMWTRCTRRDW